MFFRDCCGPPEQFLFGEQNDLPTINDGFGEVYIVGVHRRGHGSDEPKQVRGRWPMLTQCSHMERGHRGECQESSPFKVEILNLDPQGHIYGLENPCQ